MKRTANAGVSLLAMKSRRRAASLLLAMLAAACGSREPPSHEPPARAHADRANAPDIVLVSIDSLRYDHLGCYGYAKPTSPTIDRLAREGVRCEAAVSTTSWTLPAHAAMFTGLFDSAHGLVDNGSKLADGQRTLAEVLHDAGYQTVGFFGGPYLHPAFGLAQGFERYTSCMSAAVDEANVQEQSSDSRSQMFRDITGPRTLDEVKHWLPAIDRRPLFLFVHLFDVHYDYNPPQEYVDMFDPDYAGHLDAHDLPHNAAINAHMPPRELEHLTALYDGEIRFTDHVLGEIFDALATTGRLEHALVIVTADHGEEFFEHGGKGHQRSLFDEVVRVPLIVHWPGHFEAGRVVREQVRLVDLMPTLLSIAGVAERPPMQGRDIGALLRGEQLAPAPALCELLVDRGEIRALRTDASKVIRYKDGKLVFAFDLVRDPHEEETLAPDSSVVREELGELGRVLDEIARFKKNAGPRIEAIDPGSDIGRKLRALGYLGDERSRPKADSSDSAGSSPR